VQRHPLGVGERAEDVDWWMRRIGDTDLLELDLYGSDT
jgi:hypothetical protein